MSNASKKPAAKSKPTENAEEDGADDGEPDVIEIEDNETAETEEKDEDENEKSVSAKPSVKKRKLSEKEGVDEPKKTNEEDGVANKEAEQSDDEDSEVEEIN